MADLSQLSKEAKEAFVNSKMEEIRRKNEELRKRYEEVEADKRNAELNSKAAYLKKNIIQGNNAEKPAPVKPPSSVGRGKRLEKVAQEKLRAPEYQRRQQRLSEDENPPPDPVYNFLHDKSREGKDSDDRRQKSRRHVSNFGGQDFANVKNTMQMRKTQEREHPPGPPRTKMDLTLRMTGRERKEYENWRIEREKIEEDRLARQRTATGEWRREWDKDKIVQDEQESSWTPRVFRGRGRGNGRNFRKERGGRNEGPPYHENYSPNWHSRGRGGQHYANNRKIIPNNYETNQNTEIVQVEQTEQLEDPNLIDRKVLMEKDSLKISFSNTLKDEENINTVVEPKPSTKSWVGSQSSKRVGSGRILSTSSQSDDERNSFPNNKPFKRGKSKGHAFGERRGTGRGANRGARQDRFERPVQPTLEVNSQENKESTDSCSPITNSNPDKNPDLISLPAATGILKDSEEMWELGGDESWEDVTTSGNESLELSGPAIEEVHNDFKCRFDNDFDIDKSVKNLSADDPFEFPDGISDLSKSLDKEPVELDAEDVDLLNSANVESLKVEGEDPYVDDSLLTESYTENLIKKDSSYQSNLFRTCFENPDEADTSVLDAGEDKIGENMISDECDLNGELEDSVFHTDDKRPEFEQHSNLSKNDNTAELVSKIEEKIVVDATEENVAESSVSGDTTVVDSLNKDPNLMASMNDNTTALASDIDSEQEIIAQQSTGDKNDEISEDSNLIKSKIDDIEELDTTSEVNNKTIEAVFTSCEKMEEIEKILIAEAIKESSPEFVQNIEFQKEFIVQASNDDFSKGIAKSASSVSSSDTKISNSSVEITNEILESKSTDNLKSSEAVQTIENQDDTLSLSEHSVDSSLPSKNKEINVCSENVQNGQIDVDAEENKNLNSSGDNVTSNSAEIPTKICSDSTESKSLGSDKNINEDETKSNLETSSSIKDTADNPEEACSDVNKAPIIDTTLDEKYPEKECNQNKPEEALSKQALIKE